MKKYIDLHKLAQIVGWTALYVDEDYTSYEYYSSDDGTKRKKKK